MKKLLLFLLLALSFNINAQTKKEVDLSISYYDILTTLKQNELFDFIQRHDKMYEVYDASNTLQYVKIENINYSIVFNSKTELIITKKGSEEKYFVTVFNKDIIGHGYIVDSALNRVLTYFFQNDKLIKQGVIKGVKK